MQIGYHGGKCCGIKTIFHMGYRPDYTVPAIPEKKYSDSLHGLDARGRTVDSSMCLYYGPELPEQTAEERLVVFLDFLRKKRPSGLVEIAIAETPYAPTSQAPWFPVLEKLGFVRTARWLNSNSGNWCNTFHLVMLKGETQESIINTEDPGDVGDTDEDDEDSPCGCSLCV